MTRQPLREGLRSWHSRWLVLPSWNVLHRISEIEWGEFAGKDGNEGDAVEGHGVAVCGARGHFCIPGLFSRMGLRRCAHCCAALGIPCGDGAPFNATGDWWKES